MTLLFDVDLRANRRDRAARIGPELFLLERSFADCLERVETLAPARGRALLLGSPDARWSGRLSPFANQVEVADPGTLFARRAGGIRIVEDDWAPEPERFSLVVAIGTLDTVNNLPLAFRILREALIPGGLLIGAASGGETLPRLRSAMAAADRGSGAAAPRIHPRIEASALAPLLEQAGFERPVVDVDRVPVAYSSFDRLIADLRAMGATNVLAQRSKAPLGRDALERARQAFGAAEPGVKATETFEILHFAAWRAGR